MPLSPGDKLGPYEIISPIGKGGMGEVYSAHDPRTGRDVAIKVSAERFSERFDREVRAVAALNHPNICTLFDVGPDYLVMELIEGESPKGPLPLEEALRIARQIASALEDAHEKGIIHRDLKPGNIKIKRDGTVKVLDFGLAKMALEKSDSASPEVSPTLSMTATRAGMILGTAAYMAPEQAKGKTVDKRADIWAFGVVVYEMLTGERLFHGDDVTETLAAVVLKAPDLERAPVEVRRLLKKCLEKDPKKRLRDIGDVWELLDLEPARVTGMAAPPPKARTAWLPWILSGVLLLALAAAAAWIFQAVASARHYAFSVRARRGPGPHYECLRESGDFAGWNADGLRRQQPAVSSLDGGPGGAADSRDRHERRCKESGFFAGRQIAGLLGVDGLDHQANRRQRRSGGDGLQGGSQHGRHELERGWNRILAN